METRADAPVLSVCVASYNVAGCLAHGLATYADARLRGRVEVIVVNDGSTDGTHDVAQGFVDAEPSIFRLVDKENGGHGSAVNAALGAARGRYFRVIDGDDWVATDELARLVDVLDVLDADLVVDVKTEVDEGTLERRAFPLPAGLPRGVALPFDRVAADTSLAPLVMIHTLTVRTQLARDAGVRLLEHCFYVDLEFVVKCCLAAGTVAFADTAVYQYRVGSATQSVADAGYVRHFDDHTRVTEELVRLSREAAPQGGARRRWLMHECELMVNTHYKIALVFDPDRRRGWARARAFRGWLRAASPELAAATAERYLVTRVLHMLGVRSQRELDRLTRRLA